jgi:2'-5' RNA ligase
MDLSQHYNKLYKSAAPIIGSGKNEFDPLIDSASDSRRGISILWRPCKEIKNKVTGFLQKLKAIEPYQYYYPASDMHVTVMSIISCYCGFEEAHINPPKYIEVIQNSIAGFGRFKIEFRGITASPSCVMIQGFPANGVLNAIRNSLRDHFRSSELEQSLDKRYALQTAHSTVVRFRKPLEHPREFINKLELYRNYDFGTSEVESLELVYNDWYQRKNFVDKLHVFELTDTLYD